MDKASTPTSKSFKRSRDGCQNCKIYRVKCDRTKPSCKVCQRRNYTCDYSQKITFINAQGSDSRHPSFKKPKRRRSSADTNSPETALVPSGNKLNQNASPDPNDPMIRTTEEYIRISEDMPLEGQFFQFIDFLNPEVRKIFQTKESINIYEHYLSVTCSSLDALHGPGPENISQKFFLPLAVNDPATLHGILAISSSQLTNVNQSYKELSVIHKSLSYKHLYSLLASPTKAYSLETLSAIICHLSIEIIQSGVKNWKFHINALRKIINQRKEQNLKDDQTSWFIYLRVARYDNFACLTTGEDPLFKSVNIKDIPNFKSYHTTIQDIDCVFGCPSNVLFFSAELSHISKCIYDGGSLTDLEYTKDSLKLRLFEVLNESYEVQMKNDWSCINNMWCSAMGIHYYHCLDDQSDAEFMSIHIANFLKALQYFIELDSFFCANLLWPLLKLGIVVYEQKDREYLTVCLGVFYKKTNIGAFNKLQELLDEIWELIDNGEYDKPSKWWEYQSTKELWNLYMA